MKQIKSGGRGVIAIAADSPPDQAILAAKLGVTFPLISDTELKLAAAFGVRELGEEDSLPAVFIVDRAGIVRFARVGNNIVDRVSIRELLSELAKLSPAP